MLNFGASKPRVKGGPPWIRTWVELSRTVTKQFKKTTICLAFDTQEVLKRDRAVREWQVDIVKHFRFVKHTQIIRLYV